MSLSLIQKYAGNSPPYTVSLRSAGAGPHLIVNSITHGNETCGLHAILRVLKAFPGPKIGRVTFAFSNWRALDAQGGAKRFLDQDLNRLWGACVHEAPLAPNAETTRMRELRPLFFSADFLLDLHSLPDQESPFAIATNSKRSRKFAKKMPAFNTLIMPDKPERGLTLIEGGPFRDFSSHQTAIAIECGQHHAEESIDIAEAAIWSALSTLGLIDVCEAPVRLENNFHNPAQREFMIYTELTVEHGDWKFSREFHAFEHLPPRTIIAKDGETSVMSPDFDTYVILTRPCQKRGDEAMTLGVLVNSEAT